MSSTLKILARPSPLANALCTFTLDQMLFQGTLTCSSLDKATASPLVHALLQLPFIKEVMIQQQSICLLATEESISWKDQGKIVGQTIRQVFTDYPEALTTPSLFFPQIFVEACSTTQKPPHSPNHQHSSTEDHSANKAILDSELGQSIVKFLEEHINPSVAGHGGKISLINIQEGFIYVKMEGGCQGCGQANVTLRQGVEKSLKEAFPFLKGVIDITDHQQGQNPYYR
jgi:Fe-S cluster biogenesis protein NfuA